ncbi:MAG: sensor histidine kinase [Lachnospiraceae bacterium]|nr:sensor histidine kinase [Lachnospiraceae bacterium]
MTAFVVLTVLLSTITLTIAGSAIYSRSLKEHLYSNTAEMQKQVEEYLDERISSVGKTLRLISEDENVQGFLKTDTVNEPDLRLMYESAVRRLFYKYSAAYPEYLNIILASEKGQYVSNDSYRIRRIPLSREIWYQNAVSAGGVAAVSIYAIGRNIKSWKNYSSNEYISVSLLVRDSLTDEPLGVVMVDLSLLDLRKIVENVTLGDTGFVFILNQNGEVIYSPENRIIYRIRPEWFNESGFGSCRIFGKEYTLIYNRSEETGLTTVGIFDNGKTIAGVRRVYVTSFLAAIVILILGSIWASFFSKSFTQPINRLSVLMKRAESGDFSQRYTEAANGEIRQLGDSFNSLMEQTNNLIDLVYKEQQFKRSAEIRMLQEQIKPHFLYNTLDTIQWIAKEHQANKIVDMVISLGRFYRLSLSRGRENISLADELTIAECYLEIQKARYGSLFDYEIRCDEALQSVIVPKLILQPLAENALYHGIKESEREKGFIRIIVRDEGETIRITVEDDGAGMGEERLSYINSLLNMTKREESADAFGVLIVHDRLRLAYGETCGLRFENREGGGTLVTMVLGKHME